MQGEKAVKDAVRERYGRLATEGGPCCGSRKNRSGTDRSCGAGYSPEELASLDPAVASLSLGSGNPIRSAELRPGEVVVDLGSGGGIDVLLAARTVGPSGKVIGLDMTDEMVERARRAAVAKGVTNVEFRQADIETLPLPDQSVDVVISNCVINLAPDKGRVFREAFRVLRPGGRLVISDVVSHGALPPSVRTEPEAWASCVGGAIDEGEYLDLIRAAGFEEVEILSRQGEATPGQVSSVLVRARKAAPPAPDESTPIPLDARTEELVATGAALAANCQPCLRYHVRRGAEVGCTREEMRRAVAIAQNVKEAPARLLASLAERLLGPSSAPPEVVDSLEIAASRGAGGPSGACCSH